MEVVDGWWWRVILPAPGFVSLVCFGGLCLIDDVDGLMRSGEGTV